MKVNTLAGMTSMGGKSILNSTMELTRDERFQVEKEWPEQKRPMPQERREWKIELQKLTEHQYTRKLMSPLGRWIEQESNKWE